MSFNENYVFDKKTQEILESLNTPLAVYQYVDKRVVSLVLSAGFCRLFGYEDSANLFTVRSEENADESTLVDPSITIEERFVEG